MDSFTWINESVSASVSPRVMWSYLRQRDLWAFFYIGHFAKSEIQLRGLCRRTKYLSLFSSNPGYRKLASSCLKSLKTQSRSTLLIFFCPLSSFFFSLSLFPSFMCFGFILNVACLKLQSVQVGACAGTDLQKAAEGLLCFHRLRVWD